MPLYGIMLDDYNSSTCVMKEKNTTSGMVHLCSCTGNEECNDMLLFSPSEYTKPTHSNEFKGAILSYNIMSKASNNNIQNNMQNHTSLLHGSS